MTRNQKFLLAGVSAAIFGLATAGAMANRGYWGHYGHGGRHHGSGMSFLGLGGSGHMRYVCRGDAAELADHMIVRIEHKVKPTDTQQPAFGDLKTALKSAAETMAAACPKDEIDGDRDNREVKVTPIERLAQAQIGLEASLAAVKTLRPAAEKFYAALTDEQKAKLDKVRGGRHWRKGPRGPKGDDKGDDAAPKSEAPVAPQQQ